MIVIKEHKSGIYALYFFTLLLLRDIIKMLIINL